ncbi:hypothetical protein MC7420_4356 [Coleofasciculus chthonoplastes PCC 7420]|uniref:Uncharacterized protein n=1 Tax=Coleofasciculus chthonoplastes PCC 7420 TaxID=118168 RepID=B4VY52_9CYAN|nr:hypothetical protein [Coleofasciculus chthonoplastes]EDX73109.1 hypothetical protein MC7420_4356 [Coleofasciculus chthonoplastes PCC 7420]
MKLIEWLRQLFIKNLAEEKPTPLKELTELSSENLVVNNLEEKETSLTNEHRPQPSGLFQNVVVKND